MVTDTGLKRAAFQKVPRCMPITRGLGALQRVLDHGPAQQDSGKRLLALERFGDRI